MTQERNKSSVRSLYEECINPGKLELLDELISVGYAGVHGETGPRGFEGTIVGLRTAFPDINYTVEDLIAEGDSVAIRWRWSGTHHAPFRGIPASQKQVSDSGIAIYRFQDGKIVQAWLETNRLGFLQQIGLVPPDAVLLGAKPRQ